MSITHTGSNAARGRRKTLMFAVAWAVTALMVAATFMRHALGETVSDSIVIVGGLVALAATVAWFLTLDEAARQAHYVAWLWGGLAGVLAVAFAGAAVLLPLARNDRLPTLVGALFGRVSLDNAFMTGMATITAPMLVGYLLWWAAFWLRRR